MRKALLAVTLVGFGVCVGWTAKDSRKVSAKTNTEKPSPAVAEVIVPTDYFPTGSLPVSMGPNHREGLRSGEGLLKVTVLDGDHKSVVYVLLPTH